GGWGWGRRAAIAPPKTPNSARGAPLPSSPPWVIQLLVSAPTLRPPARRRRMASSMAGRGPVIPATRRIISRASMVTPAGPQAALKRGEKAPRGGPPRARRAPPPRGAAPPARRAGGGRGGGG